MDTNSDREWTRIDAKQKQTADGRRFTQIKSVSAFPENSHRRARQCFWPNHGAISVGNAVRSLWAPHPTKLRRCTTHWSAGGERGMWRTLLSAIIVRWCVFL